MSDNGESLPGPVVSVKDTDPVIARIDAFEQRVGRALDRLEAQVDRVAQIACPVCGPPIIAELHPSGGPARPSLVPDA